MAHHVWTVVCNKTLVDPATNVLSLIDVTEKLFLRPFDGNNIDQVIEKAKSEGKKGVKFPVSFQLVSWWTRSDFTKPETSKILVSFMNPEGERLYNQEILLDLATGNLGQRVTVTFDLLVLTSLGRFWFVIEEVKRKKNICAARIPLELEALP